MTAIVVAEAVRKPMLVQFRKSLSRNTNARSPVVQHTPCNPVISNSPAELIDLVLPETAAGTYVVHGIEINAVG